MAGKLEEFICGFGLRKILFQILIGICFAEFLDLVLPELQVGIRIWEWSSFSDIVRNYSIVYFLGYAVCKVGTCFNESLLLRTGILKHSNNNVYTKAVPLYLKKDYWSSKVMSGFAMTCLILSIYSCDLIATVVSLFLFILFITLMVHYTNLSNDICLKHVMDVEINWVNDELSSNSFYTIDRRYFLDDKYNECYEICGDFTAKIKILIDNDVDFTWEFYTERIYEDGSTKENESFGQNRFNMTYCMNDGECKKWKIVLKKVLNHSNRNVSKLER